MEKPESSSAAPHVDDKIVTEEPQKEFKPTPYILPRVDRSKPMTMPMNIRNTKCDIFTLMLFSVDVEDETERRKTHRIIDRFLESMVWRVQTEDEYEPDPSDVQHIGSNDVTIAWNDSNWSVDAMIMLLIDADRVEEKHQFMAAYNNSADVDHADIEVISTYERMKTVRENNYTLSVLNDPQLCYYDIRQFLKRYLFWLALFLDTRCERLSFKANNVLRWLELGEPSMVKIRNLRRALKGALLQYAYGYCSPDEFEKILCDAYLTGYFLEPIPETVSEYVDNDCLFDVSATHFEPGLEPILTMRDRYMESNVDEEGEEGGEEEMDVVKY